MKVREIITDAKIHMPKRVDVFYSPDPRSELVRRVASNIPTSTLDLLIKAMVNKFGINPTHLIWKPVDEPWGQRLDELDFMGHTCTKDCSGHRAGYAWALGHGGQTAETPSASFNTGTTIGNSKFNQRKQGGGKFPQYTSQTPNAIRKREARIQAKQQQQTTVGPVADAQNAKR